MLKTFKFSHSILSLSRVAALEVLICPMMARTCQMCHTNPWAKAAHGQYTLWTAVSESKEYKGSNWSQPTHLLRKASPPPLCTSVTTSCTSASVAKKDSALPPAPSLPVPPAAAAAAVAESAELRQWVTAISMSVRRNRSVVSSPFSTLAERRVPRNKESAWRRAKGTTHVDSDQEKALVC